MLHLLFTEWTEIALLKGGCHLNLFYNDESDKLGIQQLYVKDNKVIRANYMSLEIDELCDSLISLKDIRKKVIKKESKNGV
jgi:hypothetical protein